MNAYPSPISAENKALARHVAAAFGGAPRVIEYVNRAGTLTVGILGCRDRPREGVTAYSTLKLSDHPMPWGDEEFPTRVELAGVCANTENAFPNTLASAAFSIMRSDAVYHPGTVMPDQVRNSGASSTLPHFYLTTPFLWAQDLKTLDCGTKKVSWLLAMPISDSEYSYLQTRGRAELEHLLAQQQVDVADMERPPVC